MQFQFPLGQKIALPKTNKSKPDFVGLLKKPQKERKVQSYSNHPRCDLLVSGWVPNSIPAVLGVFSVFQIWRWEKLGDHFAEFFVIFLDKQLQKQNAIKKNTTTIYS